MKTLILTLLFSVVSYSQIAISAGSSTDKYYSPPNTCASGGSCAYTDSTVIPPTLRYGYGCQELDYDIPSENGPSIVKLGFYEPNKTGQKQRVFNVSVNNSTPIKLDIYAQAGLKKYWVMPPISTNVTDGFVHIKLAPANPCQNNPLISTIENYPQNTFRGVTVLTIDGSGNKTPIGSATELDFTASKGVAINATSNGQVINLTFSADTAALFACAQNNSNCTGLQYIAVNLPDGSKINFLGLKAPDTFVFDSKWMPFSNQQGLIYNYAPLAVANSQQIINKVLTSPQQ